MVRDVVAEAAPEELPLVAGLAGLDDAAVVRRLDARGRRHETLGFGLGEIAALVTPVVWLALQQAGERITGAVVDGAAARAGTALRRLLRRPAAVVTIPPLTTEQLALVRLSVLEVAERRGLGQERASTIADVVVARLALAPAPQLTGPDGPAGADGAAAGDA